MDKLAFPGLPGLFTAGLFSAALRYCYTDVILVALLLYHNVTLLTTLVQKSADILNSISPKICVIAAQYPPA